MMIWKYNMEGCDKSLNTWSFFCPKRFYGSIDPSLAQNLFRCLYTLFSTNKQLNIISSNCFITGSSDTWRLRRPQGYYQGRRPPVDDSRPWHRALGDAGRARAGQGPAALDQPLIQEQDVSIYEYSQHIYIYVCRLLTKCPLPYR